MSKTQTQSLVLQNVLAEAKREFPHLSWGQGLDLDCRPRSNRRKLSVFAPLTAYISSPDALFLEFAVFVRYADPTSDTATHLSWEILIVRWDGTEAECPVFGNPTLEDDLRDPDDGDSTDTPYEQSRAFRRLLACAIPVLSAIVDPPPLKDDEAILLKKYPPSVSVLASIPPARLFYVSGGAMRRENWGESSVAIGPYQGYTIHMSLDHLHKSGYAVTLHLCPGSDKAPVLQVCSADTVRAFDELQSLCKRVLNACLVVAGTRKETQVSTLPTVPTAERQLFGSEYEQNRSIYSTPIEFLDRLEEHLTGVRQGGPHLEGGGGIAGGGG